MFLYPSTFPNIASRKIIVSNFVPSCFVNLVLSHDHIVFARKNNFYVTQNYQMMKCTYELHRTDLHLIHINRRFSKYDFILTLHIYIFMYVALKFR